METGTTTYKGHEITIEQDQNPESPRTWDNICIIHIGHRRYNFGDKNYNDRESIDAAYHKAEREGDIVLPLYMYDHSGVTIALTPFSCSWDSGQVGFVQVLRKKMIEEFGGKIFTPKLKKRALEIAQGEVETMDSYMRGEIYGFIVDDHGDSVWGYYSIEDAMAEAKSSVDYLVKAPQRARQELKSIYL